LQVDAVLFSFAVPIQRFFRKVPNQTSLCPDSLGIDIEFDGLFEHCTTLYEGDEVLHVYIFIFSNPTGCRAISHDSLHGSLPPSCAVTMLTDVQLLQLKSTKNVSSSYYYTNEALAPRIEYMDDGRYCMNFKPSSERILCGLPGENSRAEDFKISLRNFYTNINVENVDKCMPALKGNVCMFSGGGDHIMMAATGNTVYDIATEEEECEPVPSPLSAGEHRTGANLELKYNTTQPDRNVEHQLKANMLLFTARHTVRMMEHLQTDKSNPISALRKVNKISTYGMSFGVLKPVVVLKLMLDFNTSIVRYEKRYQSPPEVPPEPRIDCAILYLVNRISHTSTQM
jgi:hypothetical protein